MKISRISFIENFVRLTSHYYVVYDNPSKAYAVILRLEKAEIYHCLASTCSLLARLDQSLMISSIVFKLFFIKISYSSKKTQTSISLLDRNKVSLLEASDSDASPILISSIGVEYPGVHETAYWRNIKKNKIKQICVNTIGSYFCQDFCQ